ncbi:MAG: mechanosensitive ion channel [Anaerolineales bacterium]|nr:mechanosensitive ion channel [Anaerolineales bacterium]
MFEWFFSLLVKWGVGDVTAVYLARISGILLVVILSLLAYVITRRYLLRLIAVSVEHTQTNWDDIMNRNGVFSRLAQIAPAIGVYLLVPLALEGHDNWIAVITNGAVIYMVVLVVMAVDALFTSVVDIFYTYEWSRELPIRSFVQVFKIVAIIIGIMVVASIVLNQTVFYILGSLGAVTAVLTFVFQDFIIGLVSGVQLTANGLVARGDWISVPKYDADGTILEIGLTTIKIQNADNSITTIPTQSLINESFKNWRGMQESGGRRIKRSLTLDMRSVSHIDHLLLNQMQQANVLPQAVQQVALTTDIPQKADDDLLSAINAQYTTNVGVFRAYVEQYLRQHPQINQELTLLVRQLASDTAGLPIEVYAFSKEKAFADYEQVQAGIFEHLMAVLPQFGLRIYQSPSSYDVAPSA